MQIDVKNSLTFRMVTDSNIDELGPGLSDLYQKVHGLNYDPAHWRWRYLCSPTGRTNTCVAIKAGRVVGTFSTIYLPLIYEGKRVMAGLNADLVVHPSSRSWHCLRGLLQMNMKKSLEDKVLFGFGFSTPLAVEINRLLDGNNLGRAPIYMGFLDTVSFLRGRSVPHPFALAGKLAQPIVRLDVRNRGSAELNIRRVENFDNTFDELWSAIENNRIIAVVKDALYLNWRFAKHPCRRYECLTAYREHKLEGFVVFYVAQQHKAYILELLARDDNPAIMKALLTRAFEELKTQGVGLIWASFSPYSQAAAVLNELGFKSWGTRFWNMFMTVSTDRERKFCPELDPENWDLSLGDWLYY